MAKQYVEKSGLLTSLKVSELKQLGFVLGLNTTVARKADLIRGIDAGLRTPRLVGAKRARILSIDMGIRNLAYCVLDVSLPSLYHHNSSITAAAAAAAAPKTPTVQDLFAAVKEPITVLNSVKLTAWKRTSLFTGDEANTDRDPGITGSAAGRNVQGVGGDETLDVKQRSGEDEKTEEKWDPQTIAPAAFNFLYTLVRKYEPTHVLIERQRHRSDGMSAVLEWTVRVNMLESMFFAILQTLQSLGVLSQSTQDGSRTGRGRPEEVIGQGAARDKAGHVTTTLEAVSSVNPKRVAAFWTSLFSPSSMMSDVPVGDSDQAKETAVASTVAGDVSATTCKTRNIPRAPGKATQITGPVSGKIEKETRIAIVESLLHSDKNGIVCEGEAVPMRLAFLAAREKKMNKSKKNGDGKAGKKKGQSVARERAARSSISSSNSSIGDHPVLVKGDTKLDDVSDCLLQGLAWAQWESNRLALSHALHVHTRNSNNKG